MKQISVESSCIISKKQAEEIKPLDVKGSTSNAYVVRVEGKDYFMKQLRPELKNDWRYRSAYQKEFEVGRRLSSEYIVKYEAIDEDEQGIYILMEHVNGLTLDEKLRSDVGYFARGRNFEKLFVQLLRGLKVLHESHVAYLDLKPENVMLTQVNSDVKIIDLGFCFADAYSHTAGTTLRFAAPELKMGESKEVDERTDIYALGKLMIYVKEAACVDISPRLQRIIDRCIQPEKKNRYANAEEVLKAVTKKRKWVFRLCVAIALLVAVGVGLEKFAKTNYFTTANMYLKWMFNKPQYDVMCGYNYYRILSEDSMTCEVVGGRHLKQIYIAEKVKYNNKEYRTVSIAENAFGGRRIESVYIPEGVKEIGANAFDRCSELVSVHLPSSVEKIGISSFEALKGLRSLQLSENIKEIPLKAFVSCSNLKKLYIPEGVEVLGLDCFAISDSLREVSLPSTLTTIKRGVFWRCVSLESIAIPASVDAIGEYVFFDCWNLTDVYNYAPIPQRVPPIFNKKGITLHVPRGSEELYRKADHWNVAEVVGDL